MAATSRRASGDRIAASAPAAFDRIAHVSGARWTSPALAGLAGGVQLRLTLLPYLPLPRAAAVGARGHHVCAQALQWRRSPRRLFRRLQGGLPGAGCPL